MGIFRTLGEALQGGREVTLATVVGGKGAPLGEQTLLDGNGRVIWTDRKTEKRLPLPLVKETGIIRIDGEQGEWEVMMEPLLPPPTLLIFGSGHIAEALASMAKLLSFQVMVIDDRPEYTNREKFIEADWIHCGSFESVIPQIFFHSQCYAVIVTRGHRTDAICLSQLLDKPIPYIGMVGSKRKIRFIFKLLEKQGHSPGTMNNLFAPVGLDFHSETPQEIAFSILAELQLQRNGGSGSPLSTLHNTEKVHPHEGRRIRQDHELFAAMARAQEDGRIFAAITIIHTAGHVPRGVGCRAILWEDGTLFRTIGGGRRESEIMQLAMDCLKKGKIHRQEVDFCGDYDDFQPVCGGRYTFFIQPYPLTLIKSG